MNAVDEEVVISGISGKFPECDNMKEFSEKLYGHVDLLSDDEKRYPLKYFNISRLGMLKDITKFDAEFFKIFPLRAKTMDPQMRILLELVFEAIIDSGNNPDLLRGTNTGVFIGQTGVECNNTSKNILNSFYTSLGYSGSIVCYLANRISFIYDFKGPSISLDTGCSASLSALDLALEAVKSGKCDKAIVGGALIMWDAFRTKAFTSVQVLSKSGACRTFDNDADGFVRSEAVCVVLLEKKSSAKRIYTTILGSGTNSNGYTDIGITHPSGDMQRLVMESIFKEINIDPADIEYIETHGTGTQAGDAEELKGAAKLVYDRRKAPVLVGSVKSNMGHSEGASGLSSIAKVIIAMENELIPANLHYKNPNENIPPLLDGRVKVVSENTKYNNGIVVVSNFGIGGCNTHVVLKPNLETSKQSEDTSVSRIVTVSGRTESGVKIFLNAVEESKNNDLIGLVNDIHSTNISGHSYRGYRVIGPSDQLMKVSKYTEEKRPVWFIFNGMGSQWRGMGKDLLKIEVFRESIIKCAAALKPYGVDILQFISCEQETKEHILFIIAAIQIALVDVLRSINIHPDGIIGHSMGEIPGAYADEALTLEEAMLCVYYKNKTFFESNLPPGIMASVGLSWSEAKAHCPPEVFVACDNSANNVTISGPHDQVRQLVKSLNEEGIFAKEVQSFFEAAFHSKYVNSAYPLLKKYLEKVILNPKKYSSRWVSSSIPKEEWGSKLAKTCSPEYCAKNLVNPVYFRDALTQVPDNAVVIEVNPHCMFQTILRQSLPSSCANIGLAKRNYQNGVEFFLSSIGKMYISGLQPNVQALYPKLTYPVPRGTPMISPMIEWDHSATWDVINITESQKHRFKAVVQVNSSSENYKFVKGHTIDGHILFPATGYVYMVWEALSAVTFKTMEEHSVILEDLQFHRATIIPDNTDILFKVDILVHSGEFEIHETNSLVASGKIHYVDHLEPTLVTPTGVKSSESISLTAKDVYKALRLRGLGYQGLFKGIHSVDYESQTCELEWKGNWVSFADTMLQFFFIGSLTSRISCIPTGIKKILIDPTKLNSLSIGEKVPAYFDSDLHAVQSAGIELHGLQVNIISRRMLHPPPVLARHSFIPYDNRMSTAFSRYEDAVSVMMDIVYENINNNKLNVVEIAGSKKAEDLVAPKIVVAFNQQQPLVKLSVTEVVDNIEEFECNESLASVGAKFITQKGQNNLLKEDIHLLVGSNTLLNAQNEETFLQLIEFIKPGGFILLEVSSDLDTNGASIRGWLKIASQCYENKELVLLRKPVSSVEHIFVHISQENFKWIDNLKSALKKSKETNELVIIVNQGDEKSGIVGLANCLKKEPGGDKVRCVFIPDTATPQFSLEDSFYEDILKKDLFMNIYVNKCWGSYFHIPLESIQTKKTEYAYINTTKQGSLNSLAWVESSLQFYDDLCYVCYAALNFKDVLLASGLLPLTVDLASKRAKSQAHRGTIEIYFSVEPVKDVLLATELLPLTVDLASKDCIIGIEFSGYDRHGKRIMGMVENSGIATAVVPQFVLEVPDHWSLSEAATVPVVYITAYYSLVVKGQMKKGHTVLIHSGAGGVGLAAITIALKMCVTVFTTVGSQEKREYLKKRFPQLTDLHIANSRDDTFRQHVIKATKGRGVDLVLNSLTGKMLIASLECVAKGGKFIEIGKLDLVKNSSLGMSVFLKNINYHVVALDSLLLDVEVDEELLMTIKLLENGIKSGVVEPLPATIFSENEVVEAFRFLGSSKHIGKVLIKIHDDGQEKSVRPSRKEVQAFPRTYFSPDKVYIIAGGLGGFGLELTNWLISRNAKKIVLTSRSGVQNGYQAACIESWKSMNVNIVVSTTDCTEKDGVVQVIAESKKLGAIGGIFNLAVVLKDDLFENLTEDDFILCSKPKVYITRHFDEVSRLICPDLDYFVVFSSLACGLDNQSQSNYGLANSTIERICEKRKADLLPGLAIQWGVVGDVGIVAEIMDGHNIEIQGCYPQSISSCLSTLDLFFNQPYPILSSAVVADNSISADIKKYGIMNVLAEALGYSSVNDINPNSSLSQIGADSLIIVSLKQTLERDYNLIMSTEEIHDLPVGEFQKLVNIHGNKSEVCSQSQKILLRKDKDVPKEWMPIQIPSDVLVKMQSLDIIEHENVNIFMIHPLQGAVAVLEPLAAMLPINVWGLQCTLEAPCDSVEKLAAYYIENMKTVQAAGPYLICGYSMGGAASFEIGIQLENAGEKVFLVILDAAINYFPIITSFPGKCKIQETDLKKEELGMLTTLLFLCGYIDVAKSFRFLSELKTFENCVSGVIDTISRDTDYPISQVKEGVQLTIKKLKALLDYKPKTKFSGNVLLKSTTNKLGMGTFAEDGINVHCKKNVEVEYLNGSHEEIIQNEESLKKIKGVILKTVQMLK